MSKKQQRYDDIRAAMKECGIEMWGYLIMDIDIIGHLSYNTTSKSLKNIVKNTPIKLRKSDNGVEYLIVGKNE